uniref:Fibronectin type III domain-containing protein n=1 Tax=Fundidesulfovibrio putealis TaxID=270496 RepID=A0A7C4AFQ9_9BACT
MNTPRLYCAIVCVVLCELAACAVASAAASEPVDTQGLNRQGEVYERKVRNPEEEKWTYPTAGFDTEFRSDRVYQAFPQNDAVFSLGMVISLGWHPAGSDPSAIDRYEVTVTREGATREVLRPGVNGEGKPNVVTFQVKYPGRYAWQVWAFTRKGPIIPSVLRTFKVVK